MARALRRIGIACAAVLIGGLLGVRAVNAKVATCEEITAEQGRGLTTDMIRAELNTTAARVENCARLAKMDEVQKARRSAARARRSARLGLAQ